MVQNQMTLNIISEIRESQRSQETTKIDKAGVEESEDAMKSRVEKTKRCRKLKKQLLPLKWISLFLLSTLPIFSVPNWCIRAGLNQPGIHSEQCEPDKYPNSNLMKLPPVLTTFLTLLAYALLSIFIVMRLFIKKRSNSAIIRSVGMGALMLISAIDLIWVFADDHKSTTWVVNIFNVFLILFFIRAIREIWIQFSIVMIKSVPVFIIMLSYFILFVIIGFILFANNEAANDFFTIN